jgi:hypothetical protein
MNMTHIIVRLQLEVGGEGTVEDTAPCCPKRPTYYWMSVPRKAQYSSESGSTNNEHIEVSILLFGISIRHK